MQATAITGEMRQWLDDVCAELKFKWEVLSDGNVGISIGDSKTLMLLWDEKRSAFGQWGIAKTGRFEPPFGPMHWEAKKAAAHLRELITV